MNIETNKPRNKNFTIQLDYRIIICGLIIIIAGMLAFWRPWEARYGSDARTIEVSGEATLTAVPDEFVFSPSYDFTNTNKQAALADLTKKSSEVVGKLKSLGVPDSAIKTNGDGYSGPRIVSPVDETGSTYTLSLTVTVSNKDLAQKVQDYLITTSPSGDVTPQADFSNTKQTELQRQARDQATKDARAKAEQSAANLGFKLGSVETVTDSAGFGGVTPLSVGAPGAADGSGHLSVQPGENQLSYAVTVTYFLR
jgi:uncharacterized protein